MNARVVVLAALCALAGSGWCVAGTTGTMHGYVRDDEGHPARDALVTVSALGRTAARTVTDADGFFVFMSLPPGLYTLSAEKVGKVPVSTSGVRINSDQITSAILRVTRFQCPAAATIVDERSQDFSSLDVWRMTMNPPGSFLVPLVPAVHAPRAPYCL